MSREELFREKAGSYTVCYSQECPLREHCLRNILKDYVPERQFVVNSVNLTNPQMQRKGCPHYRNDQLRRMPVGLTRTYAYVGRNSVSSIGQNQSLTSLLN